MRIGIITWFHYENYGTVLQAIALQSYLRKQGHDVHLLNYIPEVSKEYVKNNGVKKFNFNNIGQRIHNKIDYQILKIYRKKYSHAMIRKSHKFNRAILDNSTLTTRLICEEDFKRLNLEFDAFICGSDQIWNPNYFNDRYFLGFVDENVKKISYAPSFGVSKIPDVYQNLVARYVSRLTYVSVREDIGAQIITELTGIVPKVVCDPVFLLSRESWYKLIPKTTCDGKYVFCYFLSENGSQWKATLKFAKSRGLKVVCIPNSGLSYFRNTKKVIEASPFEFLTLINNATYVFTDSFHATVFSILFQKKFFVFERFSGKSISSQNSRIYNILQMVGLKNRMLEYNESKVFNDEEINYQQVNSQLSSLIETSKEFLSKALEE